MAELLNYWIIRFTQKKPHQVAFKSKPIMLPVKSYFRRKNEDVKGPHKAAFFKTEEIAREIANLYPDKAPHVVAESGYMDRDDLKDSFESVGEILPATAFEQACRLAVNNLSKTEVRAIFTKIQSKP